MLFMPPLISAQLIKHYKRFLDDMLLPPSELITVHMPNTGTMTGCVEEGSRV